MFSPEEMEYQFQMSQRWLDSPVHDKYALIVVGRMGHGKSSFCKMVANDQQRGKIIVETTMKSVTKECQMFKSNLFKGIFEGEIYVIDTPGIDSKNSIYLIVEDIDDMILKQQLHIVGIAYVLDIRNRDENQEGSSYIFTFLQILRLKHCYKSNLSFCILSKFDKYYEDEEENKCIFDQLQGTFNKYGFPMTWKNNILWMSEPAKDQKRFEQKAKGVCKDIIENQFSQLKKTISQILQKKLYLNYECYYNNRSNFQEFLMKKLSEKYMSFQFSQKTFDFMIQVPVKQESISISFLESIYNKIGWGVVIPFVLLSPFLVILNAISLKYKITKSIFESELNLEKVLNEKMQCKLKLFLLKYTNSLLHFDGRKMKLQKNPIISEMKCFNEKQVGLQIQEKGSEFTVKLYPGQNRIDFICRLPTSDCWKTFMEEISRKYYNQQ